MKNLVKIAFLPGLITTQIAYAEDVQTDSLSNIADRLPVEVVDTIPTNDKYVKIVLYNDHTWEQIEFDRPHVDEEDFEDNWDNAKIHAYKGQNIELPDEVELFLRDSLHNYCPPIKGAVRSGFKFRKRRDHKGTDIALTIGDPIRAAFDGKVRIVMKTRNTGGYGNLVVIRHPNGLETYYGHLSRHNVQENDIVRAGDVIGYGGSTGRSTGPHLHFEARYLGQPFDPERIIDFSTGELREDKFILKKHYFSIYSHYGQTDEESLAASQRKIHTIKSGDTLGGLAYKYGTTVKKICQLNGFSANKTLRIGQRVIVR
ncbi:MAG: peptidoglycan DD-metalloendopeptidase family protein [Bacteroidales bacterium]|nr:peptidoglycan DD-metalloendopeptidase family protein [Bacteroidales bacterium]